MVKIVIGDRLGKGNNVAEGIKKAGGEVVVIPGMGADMRLGSVMNEENADIGISFCGSGGAGAIAAHTQFGYSERHGMRSVQEGITAVQDGIKVLGFGFLDTEELGKKITETYYKVN